METKLNCLETYMHAMRRMGFSLLKSSLDTKVTCSFEQREKGVLLAFSAIFAELNGKLCFSIFGKPKSLFQYYSVLDNEEIKIAQLLCTLVEHIRNGLFFDEPLFYAIKETAMSFISELNGFQRMTLSKEMIDHYHTIVECVYSGETPSGNASKELFYQQLSDAFQFLKSFPGVRDDEVKAFKNDIQKKISNYNTSLRKFHNCQQLIHSGINNNTYRKRCETDISNNGNTKRYC